MREQESACDAHLRENKVPVLDAFKRITEGMCQLAESYKKLGLDGIYYAALGGERRYYTDEEFAEAIEGFDKEILKVSKEVGNVNVLHICKDGLNMDRYASYADLADVVNWGVYETHFSLEDGKKLFAGKTIMGGLANRSGVMVDGTEEELREATKKVISDYGKAKFILGADCTLPTEIPYSRTMQLYRLQEKYKNYTIKGGKNMKRKMISGLLAAAMTMGLFGGAFAAEAEETVYPAGTITIYGTGQPQYLKEYMDAWVERHQDIAAGVTFDIVQTEGHASEP